MSAVTNEMVKRVASEYLLHRGETPWRVTRRGAELWEDHAPAIRFALEAALASLPESGEAVAEPDDWFSQVVSFLVNHGMLDRGDEYDISAVMGALHDNYESTLVNAVHGIADDYMTSENHHPGYVLIPTEKFDAIRVALATSEGTKE